MTKKIVLAIIILVTIISACKKTVTSANVDPRITAHYLFKPGTYWVYSDGGVNVDSQYVKSTGSKNGYPYMQISEFINGVSTATIYIGAGPTANQLQLWGYDYINHTDAQVIFQVDTPISGTTVAQACVYEGIKSLPGFTPVGLTDSLFCYGIYYPLSNKNQFQGVSSLFFYPDFGIVQKYEGSTALGNINWNLIRSHIIQ